MVSKLEPTLVRFPMPHSIFMLGLLMLAVMSNIGSRKMTKKNQIGNKYLDMRRLQLLLPEDVNNFFIKIFSPLNKMLS